MYTTYLLLPQKDIRTYLEQKGLQLKASQLKESQVDFATILPQSPPRARVERFVAQDVDGPDLSHILLDWSEPLGPKSPWNKAALTLLAKEFIATHQGLPTSMMSIEKIFKALANTLKNTKRKVEAFEAVANGSGAAILETTTKLLEVDMLNDQQRHRRYRRNRVCSLISRFSAELTPTQKAKNRRAICKDNAWRDKNAWEDAESVLVTVSANGMSGEETECKHADRNKDLIKVPVEWIHPQLSDLFSTIDTYQPALDEAVFTKRRGNRAHRPASAYKRPALTAPPIPGLPRNWYHETWLKAQNYTTLMLLKVAPPRPLPSLVSLRNQLTFHSTDNRSQEPYH